MRSHYAGGAEASLDSLYSNCMVILCAAIVLLCNFYILHANAVNLWNAAIGYWFRARNRFMAITHAMGKHFINFCGECNYHFIFLSLLNI